MLGQFSQGYALLFYRLALKFGVDARLIIGEAGLEDVAHAWNVVKIGDVYYNLDATRNAGYDYEYFMLSDEEFAYHKRDVAYDNYDFYQQYPMSETSFAPVTSISVVLLI